MISNFIYFKRKVPSLLYIFHHTIRYKFHYHIKQLCHQSGLRLEAWTFWYFQHTVGSGPRGRHCLDWHRNLRLEALQWCNQQLSHQHKKNQMHLHHYDNLHMSNLSLFAWKSWRYVWKYEIRLTRILKGCTLIIRTGILLCN